MNDFEVHPVGTVRGLLQYIAELEQRVIAENPQNPIEINSPSEVPDEELPIFLQRQAD